MNIIIYFPWLVLFQPQNTHQLGGIRLNVHHCHERFPSDIFSSSAKSCRMSYINRLVTHKTAAQKTAVGRKQLDA